MWRRLLKVPRLPLDILKALSNALMRRIHRNYRLIVGFNAENYSCGMWKVYCNKKKITLCKTF